MIGCSTYADVVLTAFVGATRLWIVEIRASLSANCELKACNDAREGMI